jgi:lysozyme family protein
MFFAFLVKEIIKNEGGDKLVKLRFDLGGWTRFGITSKTAKRHNLDVKTLTEQQARNIYLVDYWRPNNLDRVSNKKICYEIFDHSVNRGQKTAAKLFQRSLNYYFKYRDDIPKLKVDGIIGSKSLAVYQTVPYYKVLLECIKYHRFKEYERIRFWRPWGIGKYWKSWVRRIGRV